MVTLDKINILPGKTHNSTQKIVMVCCHFLKLEILGRLLMSVFVQSVWVNVKIFPVQMCGHTCQNRIKT